MKWLNRRADPCFQVRPSLPQGMRVYAIGDVHGRLDLLARLLIMAEADHRARTAAQAHIVLLGDLIDRGPNSAEVLEYLLRARPGFARFHFVMGNHEEAMLLSVAKGADPRTTGWLTFGGMATLESYGLPRALIANADADLVGALREHVEPDHIRFLETFAPMIRFGDYLFVHAGVRPGVPIDAQSGRDLRWIRAPFLDDDRDHGVRVVHGHSISEQPVLRHNRIGIDTGAVYSGRLTALGLEGPDCWFLATQPNQPD